MIKEFRTAYFIPVMLMVLVGYEFSRMEQDILYFLTLTFISFLEEFSSVVNRLS